MTYEKCAITIKSGIKAAEEKDSKVTKHLILIILHWIEFEIILKLNLLRMFVIKETNLTHSQYLRC